MSQNRSVRACLLITQNTKQCNTSSTLRKLFVCGDVNSRVSVVSERASLEVRRLIRVRIDIFDYCIYLLCRTTIVVLLIVLNYLYYRTPDSAWVWRMSGMARDGTAEPVS